MVSHIESVTQVFSETGENDLYKITQGQAVFRHYDTVVVGYRFINRGKTQFPEGFGIRLRELVNQMAELTLSPLTEAYLRKRCGHYLKQSYIDWFSHNRYNPDEVTIIQEGGDLQVDVEALWYKGIFWEVPLLALISELYYDMMDLRPDPNFRERAFQKGKQLSEMGASFAEFGLRRRFSSEVQEEVLSALILSSGKHLTGTSNVHLAAKYGITPIGTHAHEWFMAHAGIYGYERATHEALRVWAEEFRANLGIALTDTFTTPVFLQAFDRYYAMLFEGYRWDSGEPEPWLNMIESHLLGYGIDPMTKKAVFTDSLNIQAVGLIQALTYGRIKDSYGIGTFFTNDVGHLPLNIVMKMDFIIPRPDGGRRIYVPKFSDSLGKVTGHPDAIQVGKLILKI